MPRSREEKLAIYRDLIDEIPDLQLKGKTMPYTSMNGNMFSFVSKEGILAFRLSKDRQAEYLDEHPGTTVEQYGATMRGYVEVTEVVLDDKQTTASLWSDCVANARTLDPKPTKKGG
ncbi:MAG: hypothetical protein ACR2N2_02930 [Acidimicrobiia bacterium]